MNDQNGNSVAGAAGALIMNTGVAIKVDCQNIEISDMMVRRDEYVFCTTLMDFIGGMFGNLRTYN